MVNRARAKEIDANEQFLHGKLEEYLIMMCELGLKERFEFLARLNEIDADSLNQIPVGSDALEDFVCSEMKKEILHRTESENRFENGVAAIIKIVHPEMGSHERLVLFVSFYLVIYHKSADIEALKPKVQAIVGFSANGMEPAEQRMWRLARDVEVLQDDINTRTRVMYSRV